MTPGEKIDDQIYVLETKVELLMSHLGLEFEFPDIWSNEPTGIREAKKGGEMSEKDKVWEEMSKAWDKYIKKAREYCKLSTQFQCDAELLGYCIAQLPWDDDDIENVMEWVQQGADFGENQKILSKRMLEMKEEE